MTIRDCTELTEMSVLVHHSCIGSTFLAYVYAKNTCAPYSNIPKQLVNYIQVKSDKNYELQRVPPLLALGFKVSIFGNSYKKLSSV